MEGNYSSVLITLNSFYLGIPNKQDTLSINLKELSVIIVNYNSVQDILNCIKSCFKFSSANSMEWLIVNNDLTGKGKEEIIAQFPSVRWIEMGYNAGYARANNKGINESSGDIVLLLNPDTLIEDDAIEKCFKRLKDSGYVAAAAQLKNPDGYPQITGNFIIRGGLNHLLPLPYLGSFSRKIAFAIGTKKTNIPLASKEEKADWINGAFLMVKKSTIKKAGLLDEDFFLYSEEAEWCSRLKKYGEMCVYGDLSVIHLQGESIGRSTRQHGKGYFELTGKKGLQLIISQHLRIRKQFGKGWFLFHLLVHAIEIPVYFIVSFFENLFTFRNPFKDWGKALSYSKNILTLWNLSPKIWKNEPYFYKMF